MVDIVKRESISRYIDSLDYLHCIYAIVFDHYIFIHFDHLCLFSI